MELEAITHVFCNKRVLSHKSAQILGHKPGVCHWFLCCELYLHCGQVNTLNNLME